MFFVFYVRVFQMNFTTKKIKEKYGTVSIGGVARWSSMALACTAVQCKKEQMHVRSFHPAWDNRAG